MEHRTKRRPAHTTAPGGGSGPMLMFVLGSIGLVGLAVFVGFIMSGHSGTGQGSTANMPKPPPPPPPSVTTPAATEPAEGGKPAETGGDTGGMEDVFELVAKDIYEQAKAKTDRNGPYGTPDVITMLERVVKSYSETAYAPKARELLGRLHPVAAVKKAWTVKGFPNPGWTGQETVYEPETKAFNADTEFSAEGTTAKWTETAADGTCLFNLLPGTWQTAYAYMEISSPAQQRVIFMVGTDDTAKLWLNGEKIYQNDEPRGAMRAQDSCSGELKAGTNTVLLKVNQGDGDWGFYLDIGAEREVTLSP
ncbi:MAG: hypothetical protein JW909_11280 [Planctomycetes bacterium]|nr:hypothetical protein [Planctomycetota bacterium]